MQMILKCADIGHLTAAPRTHKRWAIQLEEEFFRQASLDAMHLWMHTAILSPWGPAMYPCDASAGVSDWVGSVGTETLLCWTATCVTAFCTCVCVCVCVSVYVCVCVSVYVPLHSLSAYQLSHVGPADTPPSLCMAVRCA